MNVEQSCDGDVQGRAKILGKNLSSTTSPTTDPK